MKKLKILINFATFILAICIFAFGVYAVQTASLNITGTVGFIAHDCEVEVLGTVTNAIRDKEYSFYKVNNSSYKISEDKTWTDKFGVMNDDKTISDTPVAIDVDTVWTLGDIYFDDIYTDVDGDILPIIFTFNIFNKSAYDIKASANINDLPESNEIEVSASSDVVINPEQNAQINITFELQTATNTALDISNLTIDFSKYVEGSSNNTPEEPGNTPDDEQETQGYVVENGVLKAVPALQTRSVTLEIPESVNGEVITQIGESNSLTAVENIGDYAYVTIPESVTTIGSNAFKDCTNLRQISIPDSIEEVQNNAFNNCINLQYENDGKCNYLGNASNSNLVLVEATNKNLTDLEINLKTNVIMNNAFENCSSLNQIAIPESVKSIGDNAFANCDNLTEITIASENITNNTSVQDVNSYAGGIFKNAENIYIDQSIECSEQFTNALNSYGSTVTQDELGNNVILLTTNYTGTDYEFDNDGNLIKVPQASNGAELIIPKYYNTNDGLIEITTLGNGIYAVENLGSYTKVILPEGLITISDNAFSECYDLQEISIPKNVEYFDDYQFSNSSTISTIYVSSLDTIQRIESYEYMYINQFCETMYIHKDILEQYTPEIPALTNSGNLDATNTYYIFTM